jgi:hypothetical protein
MSCGILPGSTARVENGRAVDDGAVCLAVLAEWSEEFADLLKRVEPSFAQVTCARGAVSSGAAGADRTEEWLDHLSVCGREGTVGPAAVFEPRAGTLSCYAMWPVIMRPSISMIRRGFWSPIRRVSRRRGGRPPESSGNIRARGPGSVRRPWRSRSGPCWCVPSADHPGIRPGTQRQHLCCGTGSGWPVLGFSVQIPVVPDSTVSGTTGNVVRSR